MHSYRQTTYAPRTSKTIKFLSFGSKILLQIILGAIFTFSGFVKAIDPLGSTYKIEDYLTAFGGFFSHFTFIALPVAILLSTIELVIGLRFLFGIRLKETSIIAFILMLFMLPLTLYIALTNPVSDCGCFGDALILTNWQTFYKNIFIIIAIVLVWLLSRNSKSLLLPTVEWLAVAFFILFGIGLSIYSYMTLPMIDFRPYKVGTYIPEKMLVPEGKPVDKYETTFIYQKDGIEQEFTLDNYPTDSTWTFVDQKSVLIEKGFEPPIHDFSILSLDGVDITDEILHSSQTVKLLIMYDLNKTNKKGAEKANKIYEQAQQNGIRFIALTASNRESIESFKSKYKSKYPFYNTDPITLKTIVRSNPGLMTLKNGTIERKNYWREF